MTMVETRGRLETLARENLDLVYASALRQLKDPHAAADVTQAVFLILQRKLPEMNERVVMAAWLLRTTRYACLDVAKRARRRTHHETRAAANRSEVVQMQRDISPVIDEALDRLSKADRTAIVLAYYQGKSHEEIATRLGIGREAAHKRVQRALGKLRILLTKRGVSLPAAGITAGLTLLTKPAAAPAAVELAVINGLSGQSSAMAQAIAKGTMIMMKVMQIKMGVLIVAGASLLLAAIALAPARGQAGAPAGSGATPVAPAAPAAPTAATQVPPAGPFLPETTLTIFDDGVGHDFVADLDTATTFTPPRAADGGPFGLLSWVEAKGGDVFYESALSAQGMMGIDLAICPTADASYEDIIPASIMHQLAVSTPATPAIMSARSLPATFLFRTREGGVGVLQLVRVDAVPSSVILRMKILSTAARNAEAAEMVERNLLPEMDKLAARLASATDPADITAVVRALTRTSEAISETMKGTPARLATWRHLGSVTRVMSERVDDKQPDKATERVADLKTALEMAREDLGRMKAGG